MLILSVDTTAQSGSIALLNDASVVEEVLLNAPDGFGHVIFDEIAALLRRHSVAVRDIGLFAAAAGPGSFTGVRIGLSAMKGLGEAFGKPVVGVSNLMALAKCGTAPLRAVLIDARRGEIYGAVYDSSLAVVREEVVIPFSIWVEGLPAGDLEFITTNLELFRARQPSAHVVEQRALAAAVGRVASRMPLVSVDAVDANYVRRSDAELLWKEN